MVKKTVNKKQPVKQAPLRRTRTIQTLIEANEHIVDEKLGHTRSQSKGVVQKKIVKQPPKSTEKKVDPPKVKQAPKKNSNKKVQKEQKISSTVKEVKEAEVAEVKEVKEKNTKVAPVKKAIAKKKSPPKKSTPKKSTPKKTPVKEDVPKSEKKVEKSEKKVDTSEKKPVVEKKSEKKPTEKSDKKVKSEKKPESQPEQQEQKQTDVAKLPRRTESKATAGVVDVVFCVDTTASMGTYLAQTKNTVKEIIKNIANKAKNEDISVRFGVVCYRDHPPQDFTYVTKVQDLCADEEVIEFINKQDAQGGGDGPEAVLDGLYDAAKKIEWRDTSHTPSLRYIFHVADAPPHGKEYSSQASQWPNGVPSGVTLDKVAHVINIREIHYRLINVNQNNVLDEMKKLFKEKFTNYEETDLTNAKDMDFRVSDMIIRELLPDVDYNE